MNIKQQIERDLKVALLAGDRTLVTTVRGLKSVILYAEVAAGNRETGGVDDQTVIGLFAKEQKKRQESADLYRRGGSPERAEAELAEKAVIEQYLPKQLNDEELNDIINSVMADAGGVTPQMMGKIIGSVKEKL